MDRISVNKLNFWYGDFQALKDVTMGVPENSITALIGPSGCGKSTLIRVFNRMNDVIDGTRATGSIVIDGKNILDPGTDLVSLRTKVGMVFQRPNPFPLSVYENVVFGLRIRGQNSGLDEMAETSLRSVLLWDDLKDCLSQSALTLTLEQQQRLCIARLLAVKPEVLLMDEPCSALDPAATQGIEELMAELRKNYTILIVTHNMQQAARISDHTAFMYLGELVEFGETSKVFTVPQNKRTEDYISGKFG